MGWEGKGGKYYLVNVEKRPKSYISTVSCEFPPNTDETSQLLPSGVKCCHRECLMSTITLWRMNGCSLTEANEDGWKSGRPIDRKPYLGRAVATLAQYMSLVSYNR